MDNRKPRTNNQTKNEFYIDGNTIRRLEAAPDYRSVERKRREQERRRQEEEREAMQRRKRRAAMKNREKALRMNRGYALFLMTAVALLVGFACGYVKLQSDVTTRMNHIASLETQIADLKADNDATEKRVNTATDLDAVKDVAMNQLGMTYATPEQIVYYSVDNEDYMNQYRDIPNN